MTAIQMIEERQKNVKKLIEHANSINTGEFPENVIVSGINGCYDRELQFLTKLLKQLKDDETKRTDTP